MSKVSRSILKSADIVDDVGGEQYIASCRCDQLTATTTTGTPNRISVCYCLHCQKRQGGLTAHQLIGKR